MDISNFVRVFEDPDSGRQILAVRRNLRKYGPAVVFTIIHEDGRALDRIYYTGEDSPEAVAAIDEYFTDLDLDGVRFQVQKLMADLEATGEASDVVGELEGEQAISKQKGFAGNPDEVA